MANATTTITAPSGFRDRMASFFAGLGDGFNAYIESRSRIHQIHKLNALSDEQLASLGITRDRITAYVFRDLFYT